MIRSSASRRSSISDTEGAALPRRSASRAWITGDPLFLEGEDRLQVLLDRRMEAVKHAADPTAPGRRRFGPAAAGAGENGASSPVPTRRADLSSEACAAKHQ